MRQGKLKSVVLGIALLGLLAGLVTTAWAGLGSWHEDEKMGFKVRYPKGWSVIPMNVGEKWLCAKFLSDRAFTFTDEEGWPYEHKPEMTVIAFITEVVKKDGVTAGEDEDGDLWLEFSNPYKDYEDYLRRTYSGGGWYISADETEEIDGHEVRKLEIKVEKLTRSGPKRIITWIFKTEEVDFAVQFEVLEGAYKKQKRDVYGSLKTFKLIPRKGSLTPTTTGGKKSSTDVEKMKPEERKRYRQQLETSIHEKAIAGLPDGWTAKEMGPFLVLNHSDAKYAKSLVAHASAVWKWLHDNFDYIGEGEYVQKPIIRICKDADEYNAFFGGTSYGPSIEIVTCKDNSSGSMGMAFERVNRRLISVFFKDRDQDLYWAFPHWLDSGLDQVLGTARAKGRKLEFQADQWELEGLREVVREDKVTPIEDLVKMGSEDFYKERTRSKEAAAFVRLLLFSKNKKTRLILKDYILTLSALVEEEKGKEPEAPVSGTPKNEEEEEEQFKNRRNVWKEREQEFLGTVFENAFGDWTEKDWRKLNEQYRKSID